MLVTAVVEMVTAELEFFDLPFVQKLNGPERFKDLWSVEPTGDWTADNVTGHAYAEALFTYMADHDAPEVLGSIVGAMIEKGQRSGIEAGFLLAIGARVNQ